MKNHGRPIIEKILDHVNEVIVVMLTVSIAAILMQLNITILPHIGALSLALVIAGVILRPLYTRPRQ